MRKIYTTLTAMLIAGSVFAGGLVTNTNQSALFTRLQNRNASTTIDAVYFNPAGLTKLGNGFFASVNNQTINQTKTITTTYPTIAGQPKDYVGKVSAPLFPGVYVAYNIGNLSLSAGFNPVGGGGGAKYNTGLPSFESMVSDIPPLLTSQGIPTSGYSADIFFEGTSVYFGYQFNVAYKINDMISVAAGIRLVSAKNTYKGHLRNISINPNYPVFGSAYNGSMVKAADFFTAGSTYLAAASAQLNGTASSLQPIINGGGGTVLLSNGTAAGLTAQQVATLQGTITALGGNPAGMTIAQSQAFFSGASTAYGVKSATMGAYASATQDIEVDAEETGTGYTPILSANITPMENLNVSVRYEFKTPLTLTTGINGGKDGAGLFVAGDKIIADMPALLAFGAEYKPMDKLLLSATFNTYFDKNVDYDGYSDVNIKMIDKNFLEYGLGAEYGLTEKFRVSAGWVATSTGVNTEYQSDMTYSTNTNSVGAGVGYRINDMLDFNLGGQYTFYKEGTAPYLILNKSTWLIGAGLDFYFNKK